MPSAFHSSLIVVVAVVGWFALATHRNVRKGNATLRWMQDGLKLLCERTTVALARDFGVETDPRQANPPSRRTSSWCSNRVTCPWLWWYYRDRGAATC